MPKLRAITPEAFAVKEVGRWSRQEILGHLIDSACVNHQRFLLLQAGDAASTSYDQDQRVSDNHYQSADVADLLRLWESYNTHLVHVLRMTPESALTHRYGDGAKTMSFKELAEDYLHHMLHHLSQILTTA